MRGCAPASVVEGRQVVQLRLPSTYADAAEALNASLPGEVLRVDASPGFFTLFGSDWRVIVFCHWWLSHPHENVDGDSSDESSVDSAIESMAGQSQRGSGTKPAALTLRCLNSKTELFSEWKQIPTTSLGLCTPQKVRSLQH